MANRQHGHFTTGQAEDIGLTRPALHYQLQAGLITRSEHGVYRFTTFLASQNEREAVLTLWTRLASGVAFSHETALSHYDLGDAFPSKYHLTVPKRFRKKSPPDVVLHKAPLGPKDLHEEEILRYTTPARTILDLLDDAYPIDQLQLAFAQAVARGLIRRHALDPDSPSMRSYLEPLSSGRRAELADRLRLLMDSA